jgi:Cu(I)/Ag(I) efflux system membrane fusion protein
MKNFKKILVYTAIGITGILIGALLFRGDSEPQTIDKHISEVHTNEDGEIIYTCSMHPQIRQNEPGNCPICGMELIPADNTSSEAGPNDLVMTQAAMKLAEIETTPVLRNRAISTIRLPGKVAVNQNKSSAITSHISGRIIELYIDFEGDFVEEGERVASIYSPELIAAQQELFETAKYKEQNPVLYQAARKKLELWELPLSTINEIENGNTVMESVDIVSPVSGFVQQINVQRQQHVMAGSVMYKVADLSSVWVMFDAYESNVSVLKTGQQIHFSTTSYPGQVFTGIVDYIDPSLQNNSRSLKIRVEAENPQNRLKPNMLVEGVLNASVSEESLLLIPRSAILWTGIRSVVFVKKNDSTEPTFSAREIVLGERVGDQYVVLEGLEEGEEVVTNGTFKLDSAAQLADKLSMMNRNPGSGANRTGHEGHTMDNNATGNSQTSQTSGEDHANHQNMEMESTPAAFKAQLRVVIEEYLTLKNALIQSNNSEASIAAGSVLEAINTADMSLLEGENHMEWMRLLATLTSETESILNSSGLEEQRTSFMTLSTKLIEVVKHFEVPGVYYQQFCPMSNNGEGAYWLSKKEEIANPYFGEQMHNCGETITKIEF